MSEDSFDLKAWLEEQCGRYVFRPLGVYVEDSPTSVWPVRADSAVELTAALRLFGHLVPLPTEPASLANVLEVSLAEFLGDLASRTPGLDFVRGSDRGYPDLEFSGTALAGKFWAVDIKVAQRKRNTRQVPTTTQSRITLYTGNTYFKYPKLHWPGTLRPFGDYEGHLDVIVLYTFDESLPERVTDIQILVHEPWRIASTKRSSNTREYIGAVHRLDDLVAGNGEFPDPDAFYKYWRRFPFKVSQGVTNTLARLTGQ